LGKLHTSEILFTLENNKPGILLK